MFSVWKECLLFYSRWGSFANPSEEVIYKAPARPIIAYLGKQQFVRHFSVEVQQKSAD